MLDLAVTGGRVVIPEEGILQVDLGIAGGRLVQIAAPGTLAQAAETLDATGKHVFPGIIDPHAHFGVHTGFEHDVEHETRAALAGGITTIGCFLREPVSYHDVFERFRSSMERVASTDFFFHLVVSTEQHLGEMAAYRERWGVTSFKAYMAGMKDLYGASDDGYLAQLMRNAAALGPDTMVCIHAENGALVDRLTQQVAAQNGQATLADWSRARPDFAEAEAIERVVYLAERAGARVYIVHLNSARGVEQVSQLKQRYGGFFAESVTHYLSLTVDHPLGPLLKRVPPLRASADREALWEAVADGTIDTLGTDNVVGARTVNRPELGILAAKGGFTVLGTHLPVVLHEGYHHRGVDLLRLVEAMTSAPARLFGIFPRKGTIEVGSDADLAVVDLDLDRRVDYRTLYTWSDFSPWDGAVLRGWPVATILRGRVVARNHRVECAPGLGQYLPRSQAVAVTYEREGHAMHAADLPSLDPRHTALMVIDMQNDFVHPRGFFAQRGLDVADCLAAVPRIQQAVRAARSSGLRVIYTASVHTPASLEPRRHRVLPLRDRNAESARTALCLEGTWGAQIVDELRPEPGDLLIEKRRYSAFFDTALDAELRARGIDALGIAGATTNVCVDSTVRDAYFRGYDVVVLEDCVASYEPDLHAATLRNVDILFGMVAPAESFFRMLALPAGVGER